MLAKTVQILYASNERKSPLKPNYTEDLKGMILIYEYLIFSFCDINPLFYILAKELLSSVVDVYHVFFARLAEKI